MDEFPLSLPPAAARIPSSRLRADQVAQFTHDIAILGLGYVGLPTALAFHATGHRVIGIDIDPGRLADIHTRRVDLLPADTERLNAALDTEQDGFVLTADTTRLTCARTVVICVPTPVDHQLIPDLGVLRRACADVVAHAVPDRP